jgi:Arc/MetJ-type ribon-helix-helix transcriptional regulator
MTTQITVRLPDDLVRFADQLVASGRRSSRAHVVASALEREQRRVIAERDATIYAALESTADPDLDALATYGVRAAVDLGLG